MENKLHNKEKRENEIFTVNLIGDGFLQDQFLTNDFGVAKRKAIEYYQGHREEYIDDGYIKIYKFNETNTSGEDVLVIGFDEELKEMEIDFV